MDKYHATQEERSPGFLTCRPERDTAIDHDDITDLIIALNTTNDVSEFLVVIK